MTLTARWKMTWSSLHDFMFHQQHNGQMVEITLPNDIVAESTDVHLAVGNNIGYTFDLNGHTMGDRSVKTDNNEACVISAWDSTSRLILRNGTVLGGGAEGGIYSYFDANITLDGVNVTGSTGHGVKINDGAILTLLEDTTISGNSGCGVYTDSGRTVEVSGKPVIRDNEQGGVYLYSGVKITVTGELDETARIGVTAQETPTASNPVVITSSLSGKGTAENFFSDSAAYAVGLNADGEAMLGLPVTITFEAGYETEETMDPVTILAGSAYPLPDPEFPVPYNMIFCGWKNMVTGVIVPAKEEITVSTDTVLAGVWNYEWVVLQELIDATEDGGTLTLTRFYAALLADTNLLVGAGRTLTIDLNGNVVDGMRLNTDTVLMVNGTLTLTDSKGGGVILGQDYHSGIDLPSGGKLTLTGGTISCSGTTQAVYIDGGSFVMNGGMVTAGPNGSAYGVTVTGGGVFDLNGGIIFARQTTDGCAINICSDGYVSLQGQPVIMDHVKAGKPMTISGPINPSMETIVVKPGEGQTSDSITVTNGLPGSGTPDQFASGDPDYLIGLDADGEVVLGVPVTVTFAPGSDDATGSVNNETIACGSVCDLPACGYELTGFSFLGWQFGDDAELKAEGDPVTVTADTTVTAVWAQTAIVAGVTGSFNDKIKLNYYFEFPETLLADEGAYVTLTNEKTDTVESFLIRNAEVNANGRKFSIPLAAKEASDTITAKVFDG